MIVLDTNVISESMKPSANPVVVAWLNEQVAKTLYLSSITLAELLSGEGNKASDIKKLAKELGGVELGNA